METFDGRGKGINEEVTAGHHFDNLHDENEDRAGERFDLATGKPIDNTGQAETADTTLQVIRSSRESEDALGEIVEEPEFTKDGKKIEDKADEWLRKNDPDYKKAA